MLICQKSGSRDLYKCNTIIIFTQRMTKDCMSLICFQIVLSFQNGTRDCHCLSRLRVHPLVRDPWEYSSPKSLTSSVRQSSRVGKSFFILSSLLWPYVTGIILTYDKVLYKQSVMYKYTRTYVYIHIYIDI